MLVMNFQLTVVSVFSIYELLLSWDTVDQKKRVEKKSLECVYNLSYHILKVHAHIYYRVSESEMCLLKVYL